MESSHAINLVDQIWNLEHIWLRSICPRLTLRGWLRESQLPLNSASTSQSPPASRHVGHFSIPSSVKISCLKRPFSGDRTQHLKLVHLTKRAQSQDQFQCLSDYQPYQPLKNTCINQCHTCPSCPWLCQHCVSALRWELKLFLLRHLQKAMNIFSSQDRSLKVELCEKQNHLQYPPSTVSCRRVDGGGSRFLESRACSGCPAFATWFSRDAMKLSWERWRELPQNNFKQVNPSVHRMHTVQFNAGHFNSIRCGSIRFNEHKSIQCKFRFISFHVISIQLNQVPASPTPAANWPSIPDLPGLLWLPMPFLTPVELYHRHLPKMAGQRIKQRVQLICATKQQMNIRVEQVFWIQLECFGHGL